MEEKSIKTLPTYKWHDEPFQPPRLKVQISAERFLKRYGIMLGLMALFTVYTIVLSASVYSHAMKVAERKHESQMAAQQEEWQKQYTSQTYLLTGEASREAAMDRDAISLAHDGGVWKTEAAFKAYAWNVVVRSKRADYPNSVQEVLAQTGQYAFYDPDGAYGEQKYKWAREVVEQAYTDRLPAYLTLEHQFLEMRNGGEDCILHTSWNFNTMSDDPWRWRG